MVGFILGGRKRPYLEDEVNEINNIGEENIATLLVQVLELPAVVNELQPEINPDTGFKSVPMVDFRLLSSGPDEVQHVVLMLQDGGHVEIGIGVRISGQNMYLLSTSFLYAARYGCGELLLPSTLVLNNVEYNIYECESHKDVCLAVRQVDRFFHSYSVNARRENDPFCVTIVQNRYRQGARGIQEIISSNSFHPNTFTTFGENLWNGSYGNVMSGKLHEDMKTTKVAVKRHSLCRQLFSTDCGVRRMVQLRRLFGTVGSGMGASYYQLGARFTPPTHSVGLNDYFRLRKDNHNENEHPPREAEALSHLAALAVTNPPPNGSSRFPRLLKFGSCPHNVYVVTELFPSDHLLHTQLRLPSLDASGEAEEAEEEEQDESAEESNEEAEPSASFIPLRFDELRAKKIMNELVNAVAYLHTVNLTHRDIRPENITFSLDALDPLFIESHRNQVFSRLNNKYSLFLFEDFEHLTSVLLDFGQVQNVAHHLPLPLSTAIPVCRHHPHHISQLSPSSQTITSPTVTRYDCPCCRDAGQLGEVLFFLLLGQRYKNEWWPHLSVLQQPPYLVTGSCVSLLRGLLQPDLSLRMTVQEAVTHAWLSHSP